MIAMSQKESVNRTGFIFISLWTFVSRDGHSMISCTFHSCSTQRTEKKTKMSRRANTITNFISKYGKLLWCYMWYLRMTKTSFVGSLTSEIIVKKKNTTTRRHTIEGRLSPPSARHTARNRRRKKREKRAARILRLLSSLLLRCIVSSSSLSRARRPNMGKEIATTAAVRAHGWSHRIFK